MHQQGSDFTADKMVNNMVNHTAEIFVLPLERSGLPFSKYSKCDILNR